MATKKKPVQKTVTKTTRFTKKIVDAHKAFMNRRPHRSFRRTRKRDYNRTLKLPGFFSFTFQVHKTLWQFRLPLFILAAIYTFLIFLLTNIISEANYQNLSSTVQAATDGVDIGGPIGKAGLTFLATLNSVASPTAQDGQQIYSVMIGMLIALMIWLTTVWFLRNSLANHVVKIRDAIYNAGSPLFATFIIVLIGAIQLLPIALSVAAFVAGAQTGLLDNGASAMLLSLGALLLAALSLYWITATFMGMVVVTLPGMYPLRALSIAGDMVVGRRIRLLLRILWLLLLIVIAWAVVMLPIILLDTWLKQNLHVATGIPIVPFALVAMAAFTLIWSASYIYLLYRKVVDDDALPA